MTFSGAPVLDSNGMTKRAPPEDVHTYLPRCDAPPRHTPGPVSTFTGAEAVAGSGGAGRRRRHGGVIAVAEPLAVVGSTGNHRSSPRPVGRLRSWRPATGLETAAGDRKGLVDQWFGYGSGPSCRRRRCPRHRAPRLGQRLRLLLRPAGIRPASRRTAPAAMTARRLGHEVVDRSHTLTEVDAGEVVGMAAHSRAPSPTTWSPWVRTRSSPCMTADSLVRIGAGQAQRVVALVVEHLIAALVQAEDEHVVAGHRHRSCRCRRRPASHCRRRRRSSRRRRRQTWSSPPPA